MKELIIKALNDLAIEVSTMERKPMFFSVPINDTRPCELSAFMRENCIPDIAKFHLDANDNIRLEWAARIPVTEFDRKTKFNSLSFTRVYAFLTTRGYKCSYPCSSLDAYSLYIREDYDALLLYYSQFFFK